jgi:hypothetical protein
MENLIVRTHWLLPIALALLAGCGSKITSTIDDDLRVRVETLRDCFPGLYPRVEALLAIADRWRLGNGPATPDPTGVSASLGSEPGGTVVDVHYTAGGATIAMVIRFYGPTGVQQTLALDSDSDSGDGAASLDDMLHAAAVELRTQVPGDELPFVVGDFGIAGGGIVASNEALLGLVDGPPSAPRLATVRTCAPSSTISGGPPATDPCTITDLGPPVCVIRFATSDLALDETATQAHPIGTVELSLDGPLANVRATLTFDGTSTIGIAVDDVRGGFTFDTTTRVLAYVP